MKGFLIGLLVSTGLMVTLMVTTVMNPSFFTNIFETNETQTIGKENKKKVEADKKKQENQTSSQNSSYLGRMQKGDALLEEKYYALAAKEYRAASTLEPDLAEPFYKLGKAYFYDKNYENAQTELEKAVIKSPSHIEAQVWLGKTLIALENFDTAHEHFKLLESQDPEIQYYQAALGTHQQDYDGAKIKFQALVDNPISPEISKKASIYLNSFKEFENAEDPNPNYIKTLMARSFVETEEYNLAITTLYDVLETEIDYRDAWIILGYAYLQEEKFQQAQEALFKAVELDPTKAESRYFLGLSYWGLKDFASTITQMELALESGFDDPFQAYQKIADSAVEIGDFPKAAENYEKVLILDSSQVERFIRPIWIYIEQLKNNEKALKWAERALEEHPNEAMSHNLMGWVHLASGELIEAEENLNYALILDPDLPAAHLNFGQLNEKQNRLEEAKTNYKRAYALDPNGSIGKKAAENYNRLSETLETKSPTLSSSL